MKTEYLSRLADAEILTAQSESHAEWGGGMTLDARVTRLKHFMQDFPASPMWMSGIKCGGVLVASLKRYHFLLQIAGNYYTALGVGAVFTSPEHRRQGYSTELLKAVLKEEAALGTECALLYSAIDPSLYASVGFVACPSEQWRCHIEAGQAGDFQFKKSSEEEWEKVRGYFETHTPVASVFSRREQDSWKLFRELNRSQGDYWVEADGQTIGYLNYVVDKEKFFLQEFVFNPDNSERFWAAVQTLAAENKCDYLSGWVGVFPYPKGSQLESRAKTLAMLNPMSTRLRTLTLPIRMQLTPLDYF